ncbi:MAG TPA: membrane protein insertase YidC [Thermodesulfobacteriaceae bacterium]|nr:membrane protein insertase YidC [Thermodesulfobacteriaceae bacterium]
MESRALLAVVLSILVLVVFQYFVGQKVPYQKTEKPVAEKLEESAPAGEAVVKGEHAEDGGAAVSDSRIETVTEAGLRPETAQTPGRDIIVDTDLYRMVLSENGAAVKSFQLLRHSSGVSDDTPFDLINTAPPALPLVIRLDSSPPVDMASAFFEADRDRIVLKKEGDESRLTFTSRLSDGSMVKKVYMFRQGSYWIDMSVSMTGNQSAGATVFLYSRMYSEDTGYSFSGPSYYADNKLQEVTLDKPGETISFTGQPDWVGLGDNYFLTALVPEGGQEAWSVRIAKDINNLFQVQLSSLKSVPLNSVQGTVLLQLGMYFGPKEMDQLKAAGHNLSKSIDFGWFDLIAKPLLYFLKFMHKYIHNYGIAIILVTVLIKIVFWPLAQKSAKSMKTMQKLQPKLAKLKEKYGDDKEAMNRELMQLYKTYKVNPMGGCLPMLLQIPVFFALYKVLLQSITLRHAPFMLWINDLSAPDRLMIPGVEIPYLGGIPVLTILMGLSMWLQQKMSPSALDPTQAKIMQFLPVVFTFMFINFPAGLVLYWLTNNILTIGQQYYTNKFID